MESSIMSCACVSPSIEWRKCKRLHRHSKSSSPRLTLAAHARTKREELSKHPTQLGADLISPPGKAAALATGLGNAMFLKKHGTFWILCCGPCGPAF